MLLSRIPRTLIGAVFGLVFASAGISAPTAAAHDAHDISVNDAWVKTAPKGMTAVFGTIVNSGNAPITVVSAKTTVSAVTQLHDVAMKDGAMVMQERRGGFVIPSQGRYALKPGGRHIMLMKLKKPIKAGQLVPVMLTLSDGSTVQFKAVAKPFAAGNEAYQPSMTPAS